MPGILALILLFLAFSLHAGEAAQGITAPAGFQVKVVRSQSLQPLLESDDWQSTGGKEGQVFHDSSAVKSGRRSLRFDVHVDYLNKSAYPIGWPAVTHEFTPPADWTGFNALQFWLRVVDHGGNTPPGKRYPIRLHLRNRGQNGSGLQVPTPAAGDWQPFTVLLGKDNIPLPLDKVEHLQWFICESQYRHNDNVSFFIDGLALLEVRMPPEPPKPDEAFVALHWGDPAWATLLEPGAQELRGAATITTGEACALAPQTDLVFTFHDLFGSFGESLPGWGRVQKGGLSVPTRQVSAKLGVECPPAKATDVAVTPPLSGLDLRPGYYYVTMDILRDGKTITAGRVGCDDFHLKATGETLSQTAVGYRVGVGLYARDLLFGGLMSKTDLRLPGAYDPLVRETYPPFVQRYCRDSGKVGEHFEMGVGGCVFAAQALRASGATERARFLEWLMKDTIDYMIGRLMQDDGGVADYNELVDKFPGVLTGKGSAGDLDSRGTDQTAEHLRALARVVLHLGSVPGEEESVRRYLVAGRRMADFLVKYATGPAEGFGRPFQQFSVTGFGPDMKLTPRTQQEGSPCHVYYPRCAASVSYFAYALALAGEEVPAAWDRALRDSAAWNLDMLRRNNGHYDMACGDTVEGGCHRLLGNVYAGEAFFGQYLYARQTGDAEEMKRAAQGATMAYEFLLDHGARGGAPFGKGSPGYESQWVGPYLYWLFTECLQTIGPSGRMSKWMEEKRHGWEVERAWSDTFSRGPSAIPPASPHGGGERLSQLGYSGCRVLEDLGRPFRYPPPPQ